MSPAEIRWRCERMTSLLTHMSRMEAFLTVKAEAAFSPWLDDPRPAPAPLSMGSIHDGPIEVQSYPLAHSQPLRKAA